MEPRDVGRRVIFALAAIAVSAAILLPSIPRTSLNPRSLLDDMVEGTAWRPYVKRALVGWVVRVTERVVPGSVKESLAGATARSPLLRDRFRWEPAHATRFALVALMHLAALIGFAFALERWLRRTLALDADGAAIGGVLGLAMVPIHFGYQNFLYDFPALALFTLGLVLIGERRFRALELLWPIGMLNKETFVLLVPVFIVQEWGRMPAKRLARHVGIQLGISAVVVLALGAIYRANPGTAVEWHLMRNLTLRPPARQLVHDAIYWGFAIFAFFAGRHERRIFLATLAVMGVLFGTTLFLGFLGEYRDFYEAWPLLFALAFVAVWKSTRPSGPESLPAVAS